jgi:hypothetical protein
MRIFIALVIALTVFSTSAEAQDNSVGVKLGLLGLGVEYGYRFSDRLTIRAGLNGSGISTEETESGIDYDFDLNFDSIALGLDVHPMKGAFRVSFGLLKNDTAISARAVGSGTYTIGDTTYTGAEVGSLRGRVGFDGTAPFVGIGWDLRHEKRLGVALDFGVVDQGAPLVSLTADGLLADDPGFQADLETERGQLQSDLNDLDLYPFASFGFVFRF